MRNIYTVLILLLFTATLQAQITISFEEEESYELGSLHDQNAWEVTESQGEGVLANQVVSSEMASDGSFSFKNAYEPDYDFQWLPIFGAAKAFDTPLDHTDFTLTYDVLVTDTMGADFEFAIYTVVDDEYMPVAGVGMEFTGGMYVIKNEDYQSDPIDAEWEPNTWVTVKIEVNEEEIKYYVEEELMYTLDNFSQSDIYGMNILHNNYGNDAYYDNIRITSSTLGIEEQEFENIKLYPNPTSDFIILQLQGNQNLKEVTIYNIIGKEVSTQKNNKVDLRFLPSGTYILKVSLADGQSFMRKVIKN